MNFETELMWLGALWQTVTACVWTIFDKGVSHPLSYLYLNGPSVGGYGFWEGQTPSDICAYFTHVGAYHWDKNPTECQSLIDRHVHAFVIGVVAVLVVMLGMHVAYWLTLRVLLLGPMLRSMERRYQYLSPRNWSPRTLVESDWSPLTPLYRRLSFNSTRQHQKVNRQHSEFEERLMQRMGRNPMISKDKLGSNKSS